jgi:dihydroorotate dehydrogenase (NAD+) catalytic subunit
MPELLEEPPLLLESGILSSVSIYELWEELGAAISGYKLKSFSLNRRVGNENRTVYEIPGGLLNSMGLYNPGVTKYSVKKDGKEIEIDPLAAVKEANLKKPLICSVMGNTVDEYIQVGKILMSEVPKLTGLDANVGCPNKMPGELSIADTIGEDPELVKMVVQGLREVTRKPIGVKITPKCDVKKVAKAAEDAGADYIVCANTMVGIAVDKRGRPFLTGIWGGISGRRLKETNQKVAYDVYTVIDPTKTGIDASGGIEYVQDIIDYCRMGANRFCLGTVFEYMDTKEAVSKTRSLSTGVGKWLAEKNMTLEKLRGSTHARC